MMLTVQWSEIEVMLKARMPGYSFGPAQARGNTNRG